MNVSAGRDDPAQPAARHAFTSSSDALLGVSAFILAYALRFHTGASSRSRKGIPPLRQYINVLPFIAVLVPLGFQLQGLYRLRRGRSRVDDFFARLRRHHPRRRLRHRRDAVRRRPTSPTPARQGRAARSRCRRPSGRSSSCSTSRSTYASRELVREVLERRWRAGIGLKRILIAGSGELGRLVADKILEHRELGYQIVGFVDDRPPATTSATAGCRCSARSTRPPRSPPAKAIDHLYVALPPEQHVADAASSSRARAARCVDVKVVPDLLQVIALRARLEDLDGVPVININDVPLQGFNAIVKRADRRRHFGGRAARARRFRWRSSALLVRITSRGPVFYHQERMGLDGKSFMIVKFRSMFDDAERAPGRCGRARTTRA